jgi:hypothetical protein
MDKGDLALDEAADEDIVAVADRSRDREDLATLRMRPPVTPNWFSSDDLGERRGWPLRRLEYHTVPTNERESLA